MEDIADLICIDKQFQVEPAREYFWDNNHEYSETSCLGIGGGE
jgi:hypothetical protein